MTFNASTSGFDSTKGELSLYFEEVTEDNTIAAGTPFIVKWMDTEGTEGTEDTDGGEGMGEDAWQLEAWPPRGAGGPSLRGDGSQRI